MNMLIGILSQVADPSAAQTPPGQPSAMTFFPIAIMVAMLAFIFLTQRSHQKREKRQRQELYESISKNDRVLTVGGVIGTVVQVRGDEVVLKVDETTNTKMTFAKSAITRVLGEEGSQTTDKS